MDLAAEKRFHQLLEQALDEDGEGLEGVLRQAGAEDPELEARLRDALETVDEGLFRQPSGVGELAIEELAYGVPPKDLSEEPLHIGPYRLMELLGSGGMGRVFLAEQTAPFKRQVAVKLLKTSLAGVEAHLRFKAEQQALARLDHPNIGRILEAGTTDDGTPYFAMELVAGQPLMRYCDAQNTSLRERLQLMIAVCRGVEHAHRKQILHRDLKPSNIMVSEVDGRAVPKIIDFGIAKALDQPLIEATLATGGFLGTPTYMSPEALDGTGDLDTRGDVYSLGVLLYELLTGVKPFEMQSGGLPGLIQRLQQDETPRPSTRWEKLELDARHELAAKRQLSEADLRRRLRTELDWVVLKAMARDREERYGSAEALANDLQRYLDYQPLLASPPSLGYRLGKLVRRHRLAVAVGLVFVGLTFSAVAYHLYSKQWVSDRTASLTREVERIGWMQRVAYQLPTGDRRAEHELIRSSMDRIEATARDLDGLDRGAGDYALGRGALALGRLDEAHDYLQAAWQAGYRQPEAALVLGAVLSDLYERQLERSRLLPNRGARRAARAEAGKMLRDPALQMLHLGRRSQESLPSLLEARIALLQLDREDAERQDVRSGQGDPVPAAGKTDSADDVTTRLERVMSSSLEALDERPWLYEAHFLRARALSRLAVQAERDNELDRAQEILEREEAAVLEGLAIGRSDPDGYLTLCRTVARRLSFVVRHIRPGVDELHQEALEACGEARSIHPDWVDVDLTEASVWLDLLDVQVWDRNEDPSPSLRHAERHLRRELDEHPDNTLAMMSMARGQRQLAVYQVRNGLDPSLAHDRAVEWLETALRLQPHDPAIHEYLGLSLSNRADYRMNRGGDPLPDLAAAVKHSTLAVEAAPDQLSAYVHLGSTYVRRGQYRIEHGLDPSQDIEEGRRILETLMEAWPTNGAGPNIMANLLMLQGLWTSKLGLDPTPVFEEAVTFSDLALKNQPGSPYSIFTRGQLKIWIAHHALVTGDEVGGWAAAARRDMQAGFETLPNLPGPHVELAVLTLAEARFEAAHGRDPEDRVREAQRLAHRALEIDDARADARRVLAETELVRAVWLHRRGGGTNTSAVEASLEQARQWAAQALEQEPGDAENQLAMARYAWRRGQFGGAARWLQTGLEHCDLAAAIDPMSVNGKVLRGALLMEDPARRDEGEALVDAALRANGNLRFLWGDLRR